MADYIHVYLRESDTVLRKWAEGLREEHYSVAAVCRDILLRHVQGERALTAEDIAATVVRRLKEEGLVVGGFEAEPTDDEDIMAALANAAQDFMI